MKALLSLVLVTGWTSGAGAALTLVNVPTQPIEIGQTTTITVRSTMGGDYSGWLQIADPSIINFAAVPQLTPAGNRGGASALKGRLDFGAWYEFKVISLAPHPPIAPGDHLLVDIVGLQKGSTRLNLYASDGVQLWESASLSVAPEPATLVLLGLGGLLLRRRR